MSAGPKITAGIAAYKAQAFLAEAIETVLAQTLPPSEIIVLVDGSPDGSANVARRYVDQGVRVIEHEHNQGIGAARNSIIDAMSGDYLAFLDADDLWTPDHLDRLWTALETAPECQIAFGRVEQFLCPQIPEERRRALKCPPDDTVAYVPGGMLAAKSAYEATGPFDAALKVGEFIDWFMKAKEAGVRHKVCDDLVLKRRIHGENTTLVQRDAGQGYALALKQALDRRRAAAAGKGQA